MREVRWLFFLKSEVNEMARAGLGVWTSYGPTLGPTNQGGPFKIRAAIKVGLTRLEINFLCI